MIIVRWANSKEYIKTKFLENLELNFPIQEQIFNGNNLNQLNIDQRKILFKHLNNIELINNYKYYIIDIKVPYIVDNNLQFSLKTLNKTNISIIELINELRIFNALLEQRERELSTKRINKNLSKKIIEKSQQEKLKKKPWWRFSK